MAENRYIVTRSNYSIRKRHKILPDSSIYARDYMVTSPTSFDINSFTYPNSNFKFVRNENNVEKRFHSYGEWVPCNGDTSRTYWSGGCLKEVDDKYNRVRIKEKYTSLLDFSYYGSCSEMFKAKISEIIRNFPAELYISDSKPIYWVKGSVEPKLFGENIKEDKTVYSGDVVLDDINSEDLVKIENPFEINISYEVNNVRTTDRDFSRSSENYNILYNNTEIKPMDKWRVLFKKNGCLDGELTGIILIDDDINGCKMIVYEYYSSNNGYVLVCDKKFKGVRIRPNDETVDKFYESIDEYGRFILNRDSKPLYTCNMYYHYETEHGIARRRRNFTWPSSNGWNLIIDGHDYNNYINSLLTLCELYDEIYTNNFIRMMTHEAIKNMDLTRGTKTNEDDDDYIYGTTKITNILNVIACFFDDIKRKIDNIGRINTVTYNEEGNTPDYFLTDKLNNLGWEIKSPTSGLKNVKTNVEYGSESKNWSLADVNNRFYNNLILNSKQIVMKKGTKSGIESLLNLFGLKSHEFAENCKNKGISGITGNYKLEEYVQVAKPNETLSKTTVEDIERMNSLKDSYVFGGYEDDYEDTLQGLPVLMVNYYKGGVLNKYLIPWFKGVYEIDGNPYYQMYGGWGKRYRKANRRSKLSEIKTINGDMIYEETYKRLLIVNNIGSLMDIPISKLYNGIVVYVYDISDYDEYFDDLTNIEDRSNYFVLNDIDYSGRFYNENSVEKDGWKNISYNEISKPTYDGYKVLYLENIIDENKGNNPHLGRGMYDDGNEYYDYFKKIFKGAMENDTFKADAYDCESGLLNDVISKSGFDVKTYMDNMKCRYYTDNIKSTLEELKISEPDSEKRIYDYKIEGAKPSEVKFTNDYYQEVDTKPYDFETTEEETITESSANSIINTKVFKIIFKKISDIEEVNTIYRDFIENSVLPYVMQIIPSTAVCTFMIEGDDENIDSIKKNTPLICGVTD